MKKGYNKVVLLIIMIMMMIIIIKIVIIIIIIYNNNNDDKTNNNTNTNTNTNTNNNVNNKNNDNKIILITNNTNKVIGKYCYSVWKGCVCVIQPGRENVPCKHMREGEREYLRERENI